MGDPHTERWRLEKARRLKALLETGELAYYIFPKQAVAQRIRREREAKLTPVVYDYKYITPKKPGRPKIPNDQRAVRLLKCVGCGKPIHVYRKSIKPGGNHCTKCWGRILGTHYHPLISGSIRPPRKVDKTIMSTMLHKIGQSVKHLGPIKCDGHTCASCKDPFGENCPLIAKTVSPYSKGSLV